MPFTATCSSSKYQDEIQTTADIDFDDHCGSGHESTSGGGCGSESNPSDESLTHTITLATGSSSHAHAGSGFFSHKISLPSGQASSTGFVTATCY